MNIHDLHQNWTALGKDDPMWVVLTDPEKKGGGWNAEEFFATGRAEIHSALEKVRAAGVILKTERALDFGCGLGRLSQPLGETFARVDGVDVSASMIEQAKKFNRRSQNVFFHLNVRGDLESFPAAGYDFIYSNICLQHIPPKFQLSYIADFMRRLRPGGAAYFQTIHALGWRRWVPNVAVDAYRLWRARGGAFIPMYGVPVSAVNAALTAGGGTVKQLVQHPYGGHESRYQADWFLVVKKSDA